jgi:hypothetical protein
MDWRQILGEVQVPLGEAMPKFRASKPTQSLGITNLSQELHELGVIWKSSNREGIRAFEGARSQKKSHQVLMFIKNEGENTLQSDEQKFLQKYLLKSKT